MLSNHATHSPANLHAVRVGHGWLERVRKAGDLIGAREHFNGRALKRVPNGLTTLRSRLVTLASAFTLGYSGTSVCRNPRAAAVI